MLRSKEMYKDKQEVIDALISGETNSHSIRTQASKARIKKNFSRTMMFIEAVEEYNMFYKPK